MSGVEGKTDAGEDSEDTEPTTCRVCSVCTYENPLTAKNCEMCYAMVDPDELKWRNELKIDDTVEIALSFNGGLTSTWVGGVITKIMPNNKVEVTVMKGMMTQKVIELETSHSGMRRSKDSMKAPKTTRHAAMTSEDRKWREGLKVGDLLDALDTDGMWYIAEILKLEDSEQEVGGISKQIYIHFTEWTSQWDMWVHLGSENLKMPHTVSKSRQEQQLNPLLGMFGLLNTTSKLKDESLMQLLAREMVPDYTNVVTTLEDHCIHKQAVPALLTEDDYGRFIRKTVAADNNCLYHAISFVCEGQATEDRVLINRKRCFSRVEANKELYVEFLGEELDQYVQEMRKMNLWGGFFELRVFSEIFHVQVVAIDIQNPKVYKVPQDDKKYKKRVFVLYQGTHYDALVFCSNKDATVVREFFSSEDALAMKMAVAHAELLHLMQYKHGAEYKVEWLEDSVDSSKKKDVVAEEEKIPSMPSIARQQSAPHGLARQPRPALLPVSAPVLLARQDSLPMRFSNDRRPIAPACDGKAEAKAQLTPQHSTGSSTAEESDLEFGDMDEECQFLSTVLEMLEMGMTDVATSQIKQRLDKRLGEAA